jgi:hypothetical protein
MFEGREKEYASHVKGIKRKLRDATLSEGRKRRSEGAQKKRAAIGETKLERLDYNVDKLERDVSKERQRVLKHMLKTIKSDILLRRSSCSRLCSDPNRDVRISPTGIIELPPNPCSSRRASNLASPPLYVPPKPMLLPSYSQSLPRLHQGAPYAASILRIWEYALRFKRVLGVSSKSFPNARKIQEAIKLVDFNPTNTAEQAKCQRAVDLLTRVATALCMPLSKEVKKLLVTSNETRKAGFDIGSVGGMDLPVNEYTWEEVARLALLDNAFGELGVTRTDQTYAIRGQGGGRSRCRRRGRWTGRWGRW